MTYESIARDAEIVTPDELKSLLETGGRAYIGFEPSGLVHIGWLVCMKKMKEIVDAGFNLIVYLADWHAFINDKLGGDMDRIHECASYLREVFNIAGIRAEYIMASELMDSLSYWEKVMRVAKATTMSRMRRAMTIMGRKGDEADTDTSKILYPALQVADMFEMDIDIALGGMDQRHAHMLQRDVAEKLGWKKVVAIHTPLISGLTASGRMDPIEAKMSKSRPEGTITLHDSPDEIRKKLKKAYCPVEIKGNPVLEIVEHIVIPYTGGFNLMRDERYGGPIHFSDMDRLIDLFLSGEIHPLDLKMSVAEALINLTEPFRRMDKELVDRIARGITR